MVKICHFIWDLAPLSFTNAASVWSFQAHNPEWEVWIWQLQSTMKRKWKSGEHPVLYKGKCYFDKVCEAATKVIKITPKDVHPTIKDSVLLSDFLRYQIMYKHGGLYSDFDILYFAPLTHYFNTENRDILMAHFEMHHAKNNVEFYFPVALFYAPSAGRPLWKKVVDRCAKRGVGGNQQAYQAYGRSLWDRLIPVPRLPKKDLFKYGPSRLDWVRRCLRKAMPALHTQIRIAYAGNYLPVSWRATRDLYVGVPKAPSVKTLCNAKERVRRGWFGIHWFNGDRHTKQYLRGGSQAPGIVTRLLKPYASHR